MKYHDENNIDQIDTKLWIGNYEGANDINLLKKNNIKVIINFFEEFPYQYKNIIYYNLPFKFREINLNSSWNLIKILKQIYDKHNSDRILISCQAGHHRSANGIVLYLINKYKWDYNRACNHVKSIRLYSLDRESNFSDAVRIYGKIISKIYN